MSLEHPPHLRCPASMDARSATMRWSNVNLEKLKEIVDAARIKPAVVETESHPYLPERELLDYCRQQGIVLLAFAALGHGMKPADVAGSVGKYQAPLG